jgi:hypothetical protein
MYSVPYSVSVQPNKYYDNRLDCRCNGTTKSVGRKAPTATSPPPAKSVRAVTHATRLRCLRNTLYIQKRFFHFSLFNQKLSAHISEINNSTSVRARRHASRDVISIRGNILSLFPSFVTTYDKHKFLSYFQQEFIGYFVVFRDFPQPLQTNANTVLSNMTVFLHKSNNLTPPNPVISE